MKVKELINSNMNTFFKLNKMDKKERKSVNFDQLPEAVSYLIEKIDNLELIIKNQPKDSGDEFLTVEEASAFLTLSLPTVYSKVSKKELPYMKQGKRLYFLKSDLIEYIKNGRVKTVSEVEAEADQFLTSKKRK